MATTKLNPAPVLPVSDDSSSTDNSIPPIVVSDSSATDKTDAKNLKEVEKGAETALIVLLVYVVLSIAIFIWTIIALSTFNVPENMFILALVLFILFFSVPGLNIVPLIILYMNKK